MTVRVITRSEVARLLPMSICMDVMVAALQAAARGEAVLPERLFVRTPDQSNILAIMPAYMPSPPSFAIKAVSVTPENAGGQYPVIQGSVLLFETEHGRLVAIMDADEITAIRTAAVSGAATRVLAREDASDLAILGTGVQARTHLAAMLAARPIRRIRVWNRTTERARQFAQQHGPRHGLSIEVMDTPRDAVLGADIICTLTASPEPIVRGEWLSPGAHINAVGFTGQAESREVDTAAVVRSRVYVDKRESAMSEGGEILMPIRESAVGEDHIVGELGELFLQMVPGRTSSQDITLVKAFGLAVEDAAAAQYIYAQAETRDAGVTVDLST